MSLSEVSQGLSMIASLQSVRVWPRSVDLTRSARALDIASLIMVSTAHMLNMIDLDLVVDLDVVSLVICLCVGVVLRWFVTLDMLKQVWGWLTSIS